MAGRDPRLSGLDLRERIQSFLASPAPKIPVPGLVPGIHVFLRKRSLRQIRRGWPDQVRPRGACSCSWCVLATEIAKPHSRGLDPAIPVDPRDTSPPPSPLDGRSARLPPGLRTGSLTAR